MPRSDRPAPDDRDNLGIKGGRPKAEEPPKPPSADWLTEFMRREDKSEDRIPPSAYGPLAEPAENSYRGPALIGIGILLAVGLVGAFGYLHVSRRFQHADRAALPPLALTAPKPAQPAAPVAVTATVPKSAQPAAPAAVAHSVSMPAEIPAPPQSAPAAASIAPVALHLAPHIPPVAQVAISIVPHIPLPAPEAAPVAIQMAPQVTLVAQVAIAIVPHIPLPAPEAAPIAIHIAPHLAPVAITIVPHIPLPAPEAAPIAIHIAPHLAPVTIDLVPHIPLPAPEAAPIALTILPLQAPPAPQAPPAAEVLPSPAPPIMPDALPTGTALHLHIVYTPADPAEGARIDALTAQLRSQVSDVATATVTAGPAASEGVVYFFPDDRAGASRIAASLVRLTKRPEPVVLVHAKPLPRPGTVEIRLPLKVGKDLTHEGS